jgi:hypothetical protein
VYLTPGEYHKIEYRVKNNTPGSANGIIQVAIDGVLRINVTDAKFIANAASAPAVSKVVIDPMFGGGSDDTVAQTQDVFFDHAQVFAKV